MIAASLLKWYRQHKRDLPWRHTQEPYKVWLSEVILQQTRVAQGLPYYLKFTETFPTVFDLAKAPEQKVLKLWQGLGYYSRARNLHTAAKEVVKNFGGKFPPSYKELLQLKGVGDYTAAAIASFCFNEPHAVVDGNVYRVLARLFVIDTPINSTEGKKQFAQLAHELLDKKRPGEYNQAIMEFGAIHCTPQNPSCGNCPLNDICQTGPAGKALSYPVKISNKKIRERWFEYLVIQSGKSTFIKQRGPKDVWQGLYEFPLLEYAAKPSESTVLTDLKNLLPAKFTLQKQTSYKKHLLSHQTIYGRFTYLYAEPDEWKGFKKVTIASLKKYPFPVLIANELPNFEKTLI